MEGFSLLKYWKSPTTLTPPSLDTHTDADDGPFFDLELAVPDDADADDSEDSDSDTEQDKDINLTLSPSTSNNQQPTLSLSPSHDFIFKGNLNIILNSPEPNSNSKPHPQFTASLFKSARVFISGLKKPKPKPKHHNDNNNKKKKLFTVKFKVEEVPIVSLFTRDNSSRGKATHTETQDSQSSHTHTDMASSGNSEEKRLMRKYFKMVKPLYVRVSKRYDKVDVTSPESAKSNATVVGKEPEDSETANANVKAQKQGNVPLPAGLRKHLGKGRSAAPAPAPAPTPAPGLVSSKRLDDSLLQQQDWIQGAILHCKNSFNASAAEFETCELPRSVSDISQLSGKSKNDN